MRALGANSCPHVAVSAPPATSSGRKEDGARLAREDELGCSAGQVWLSRRWIRLGGKQLGGKQLGLRGALPKPGRSAPGSVLKKGKERQLLPKLGVA